MVYILQPFWWLCITCIPWFFALAYLYIHQVDNKALGARIKQEHLMELAKKLNELLKEKDGE